MSSKDKKNAIKYVFSKKSFTILVIYFIFLLIVGLVGTILIIAFLDKLINENLFLWTALCSICAASTFSSIKYLRILYKACITSRIDEPSQKSFTHIGNVLYFVLRPIFAIAFCVIVVFSLMSGIIIVTASLEYVVNERFLFLSVIISSIVGYSIGTILDKFEILSKKQIEKTLYDSNNETGDTDDES